MSIMTGSLVFIGAGCASGGQVGVTAGDANGESALEGRSINLIGARAAISVDEETGKATTIMPATDGQEAAEAPQAPSGAWPRPTSFPGILPKEEIAGKQARIATSKGTVVVELLAGDSPKTVSNFVALAKSGYYDGLSFHRYVPGFVIQGGDPRGDGTGGPGYKFEDEPIKRDYAPGIMAMANAGPDTNGSQFFIVLEDSGARMLEPKYNIFGQVTSGMDVVRSLRQGDVMTSVVIEDKR